jgi:poly(A) polymerase
MMRPFSLAPVTSPAWSPDSLATADAVLPGVPQELLEALVAAAAPDRVALVGGAVRDLLLHRVHADPWRGLTDLDLVVEAAEGPGSPPPGGHGSPALRLAERLRDHGRGVAVRALQEHGAFGTVEVELACGGVVLLLDLATARRETYRQPGENPQVCFGSLAEDLARRDFTINAMALRLGDGGGLLDPHGGLHDLRRRRLRLLHGRSLADDPTRIVRAARYAARLGFRLDDPDRDQLQATLAQWPWCWRPGDPPAQAPPALATRMRMELELLLERERAPEALAALQGWGGLALLDPGLQADRSWSRRLAWGRRFGLPPLATWLAAAHAPLPLAQRLQLPHRQQRLLEQFVDLGARLASQGPHPGQAWPPSRWCALLEASGSSPEAVALRLASGAGPRRPLLRWWVRWRHIRPELGARDLLAQGWAPGPALGERLRQLRWQRLDRGPG